ncbi:uncharacterized protein [Leptinotarsa decemlineata]|uniref:uncharacterized protein n=1 Tax=Leptinotarsa decemlineata TaxID=7539 RepID=UPI003D304109
MKIVILTLLLSSTASAQYNLESINNSIGVFFHQEGTFKITNEKWTLLIYKDLSSIKDALYNDDKILENLIYFLDRDEHRILAFKAQIKTHTSLLTQISDSLQVKFRDIFTDTEKFEKRTKRGLINGAGTFWKAITGNLDASDGEYFTDCINKISQDEHQIENLLKNQISVTTSVIKNFNSTIQKLQVDEETFNQDIKEIEKSLMEISDDMAFYEAQIKTLEICESLMESYLFLETFIGDIINSITFARLKIIHGSIITSRDLLYSLQEISQTLNKNNLPLYVSIGNIPQYLDLIELQAYQTDNKVVFVLNIPLVEPETYTLFHLYPIPILDARTGLHHILLTFQKFIARDDDSMLYTSFQNLDNCKVIKTDLKICAEVLPYPIDSNAICEAQLLKQTLQLPENCKSTVIYAKDYNVQVISQNLWLISISDHLPVTINCIGREVITKIIETNTLLKLQPECNAFIGNTRVHSKYFVERYQNVTYNKHAVQIPYRCCDHLPGKLKLPELKPLKLNKINVDDLNIAEHKLNQYSDELDKLINEPFVNKHISWFTYFTIALIIALVILYIFCKCHRKKSIAIGITSSSNDNPPRPPRTRIVPRTLARFVPRRRPSVRLEDPVEEDVELTTSLNEKTLS